MHHHCVIAAAPNVSEISTSQRVDQVLLIDDTNVNVTISFKVAIILCNIFWFHVYIIRYYSVQAANTCSSEFPVVNYTLSIMGLNGSDLVLDASDYGTSVSATLSSLVLPDFKVNQQYHVSISACTDFTCRRPKNSLSVCKSTPILLCL